jgi:hypothetical protein
MTACWTCCSPECLHDTMARTLRTPRLGGRHRHKHAWKQIVHPPTGSYIDVCIVPPDRPAMLIRANQATCQIGMVAGAAKRANEANPAGMAVDRLPPDDHGARTKPRSRPRSTRSRANEANLHGSFTTLRDRSSLRCTLAPSKGMIAEGGQIEQTNPIFMVASHTSGRDKSSLQCTPARRDSLIADGANRANEPNPATMAAGCSPASRRNRDERTHHRGDWAN